MNEQIISTLIGLTGAIRNGMKTEHTDALVMQTLLRMDSDTEAENIAEEIREEKYTISPSCRTCASPCGNTSDFDMRRFRAKEHLVPFKEELLQETVLLVHRLKDAGKNELPEEIYQAIEILGYDLAEESYRSLTAVLKQMEV